MSLHSLTIHPPSSICGTAREKGQTESWEADWAMAAGPDPAPEWPCDPEHIAFLLSSDDGDGLGVLWGSYSFTYPQTMYL